MAALSLLAASLHLSWSFDAVTYRLPRCLYWLYAGRWHWIGTIDGRLDYSSCGLEWQMIPVLLLTKTDRFLFLLSFLPFLLLPGLTYLGGRTLGIGRKPLLVWMWLLPCAYCIALQASGLQNDGYTTSYTMACLAFSGHAIRRRNALACVFAGLALALLTGAKLSNLPLMLPLGLLLLVAGFRSRFFASPALASLPLMVLASFLPLAILSIQNTGTWTGDPDDQWGFRTGNPVAATIANLIIAGGDLVHPPVMVGTSSVNRMVDQVEAMADPLMGWLKESHRMFRGVSFGDLIYEGGTGPGFPIGVFLAGGLLFGAFTASRKKSKLEPWQRLVLGCGLLAWLVLLSQLGSGQSPRNAVPYLPLLLFGLSRCRPFHGFLYSKTAPPLAIIGMLSIIPVIMLTPARPLIPLALLEKAQSIGPLASPVSKILEKYRMWETLRDDMKPMREHLPKDEEIIGYAGAFRDTSYGLWKPLGSRVFREIGIPINDPSRHIPIPDYVVATERGIQQRFGTSLSEWMQREHKVIRYSFQRSTSLESDDGGKPDEWYLLGPE